MLLVIHVNKVNDMAVDAAVYQIADGATQYQGNG